MASYLSGKERRAERLRKAVSEGQFISRRAYNLILGGVTLYGLVVNFLLCKYGADFAMSLNPLILIIGYIVLCIGGVAISRRSDNALVSFLGYNMVVVPLGLVLSTSIAYYGGVNAPVVQQAMLITACITAIMTAAAVTFPQFFSKLGRVLIISLLAIVIVGIVQAFMRMNFIIISYASAALFSLYIGFDVYRSQQFSPTADNAVDCALDLYLDIINLFTYVLRIIGNNND